ncbi:hypothetical protein D3C81_2175080 [compost metagenome]
MHTAGIFRDVAAYGAGDLRRRIGCIVEAERGHRFGDSQIAYARLHHGSTCIGIDFDDFIEACGREDDAIGDRQGATG